MAVTILDPLAETQTTSPVTVITAYQVGTATIVSKVGTTPDGGKGVTGSGISSSYAITVNKGTYTVSADAGGGDTHSQDDVEVVTEPVVEIEEVEPPVGPVAVTQGAKKKVGKVKGKVKGLIPAITKVTCEIWEVDVAQHTYTSVANGEDNKITGNNWDVKDLEYDLNAGCVYVAVAIGYDVNGMVGRCSKYDSKLN